MNGCGRSTTAWKCRSGAPAGAAHAVSAQLLGVFEPVHYTSVFDYINFMDAGTYATLYNYTGVQALPDSFNPVNTSMRIGGIEGPIARTTTYVDVLTPEESRDILRRAYLPLLQVSGNLQPIPSSP